jgi:hypothetical protein
MFPVSAGVVRNRTNRPAVEEAIEALFLRKVGEGTAQGRGGAVLEFDRLHVVAGVRGTDPEDFGSTGCRLEQAVRDQADDSLGVLGGEILLEIRSRLKDEDVGIIPFHIGRDGKGGHRDLGPASALRGHRGRFVDPGQDGRGPAPVPEIGRPVFHRVEEDLVIPSHEFALELLAEGKQALGIAENEDADLIRTAAFDGRQRAGGLETFQTFPGGDGERADRGSRRGTALRSENRLEWLGLRLRLWHRCHLRGLLVFLSKLGKQASGHPLGWRSQCEYQESSGETKKPEEQGR